MDMTDLMKMCTVIASAMPEEIILEKLEIALKNYRSDQSKKNTSSLIFAIRLMETKIVVGLDGLSETLKSIDEAENAVKIASRMNGN
jgi:hypothetical protein